MGRGDKVFFFINGPGNMTKITTTPIYGKKNSCFFRTSLMILKLGIDIEDSVSDIYINGDLGLTLSYFTARSTLVSFALIWGQFSESHKMKVTRMTKG